MERRREPRRKCLDHVVLIDLSTGEKVPAVATNSTRWGLQLTVGRNFRVGAPVQIEHADFLMLGDVCYSREDNGSFTIGIALAHSVEANEALAALARKLSETAKKTQMT